MDEELAQIKKLEFLTLQHQELDAEIDRISAEKFCDLFRLNRLKKDRLLLRDEMSKLQDALYPDIIA